MKSNSHDIEISNKEKIFFPKSGITKGDIVEYYNKVADYMLPYLKERPITMHRFPNGISGEGFYQKDRPDYFPEWIESFEVKKEGGTVDHIICNNKNTLIYLANQACLTFHIWLCRKQKLKHPDKLVFDLDPPEGNFELVIKGAKTLRKFMEDKLDLPVYLMTTGSKGIHVVISLAEKQNFDEVREFARKVSAYITSMNPREFTTEVRKEKRKGRLFIDCLRNSYAQTSVAPYSVRAKENAPVATPIRWQELSSKLDSKYYHVKNIFRRLGNIDDPWKDFFKKKHSIKNASDKLNEFLNE